MRIPTHVSPKVRLVLSKLGSLILLLQKSPVVQMILPEARVAGVAGVGELAKWSVAVVAGLGAFDSVAGATTITQLKPAAGSTTVPATSGASLSFVFQMTGAPGAPQSWKVTGTLPAGLVHNATAGSTDSITGVPTQTGSFPITISGYEFSNFGGPSKSQAFTIVVATGVVTAPAITTQPSSVTIASGTTTTLSVTASGTSPTFQWYIGNSGDTTHPVAGATSSSFTTPALTATTTYWVRASNSKGTASSNAAKVTVMVPPSFTTQPSSVGISAGQTATLSVVAKGTSLKYQWYAGSTGTTTSPIVGATSSSYTTPALTATSKYWVKISNALGSKNSNTATVTVMVAPAITKQPVSSNLLVNHSILLSAAASGTTPTYQWYIGASGDVTHPIAGATSASYTTPLLTATTKFWVRASNAAGHADSSTATVNVIVPLVITTQPLSKTITAGTNTSLKVVVTGSTPTYQWYIGSSGVTTKPVTGGTNATLTLTALTATTTYWVRIKNLAGTVNSKAATITVTPKAAPLPASSIVLAAPNATGSFSGWLDTQVAKVTAVTPGGTTSSDSLACNPCVLGTWPLVPAAGTVSFTATSAATAGCAGALHYTLETASLPDSAEWKSVPGFADIVGDDKPRDYAIPAETPDNSYRIKVSLVR